MTTNNKTWVPTPKQQMVLDIIDASKTGYAGYGPHPSFSGRMVERSVCKGLIARGVIEEIGCPAEFVRRTQAGA